MKETIKEALRSATAQLREAGLDGLDGLDGTASLDARLLLQHVLSCTHAALLMLQDQALTAPQREALQGLLQQRMLGKPIAKILGRKEFFALSFFVNEDVLDPRPESELLVEEGLSHVESIETPLVLDMGTGSGCLLLSLLHHKPHAQGVGIDISRKALDVAMCNAASLGLLGRARFMEQSFEDCASLGQTFDLILANPPYIPLREREELSRETLHDPFEALFAGEDGLCAFRAIFRAAPRLLAPHGLLVLEVGQGQAPLVEEIFQDVLVCLHRRKDLLGIERALLLRRP